MGVMIEGFALDGRGHPALITYINNDPVIAVITADDKTVKVYKLSEMPGKIVPLIEAKWIPIKKKMYSKRYGWEEITGEYECSRCGHRERDPWVNCRCGATMTNGCVYVPLGKTANESEADEP